MFPFFRNIGNKMAQKERTKFLGEVNDALLSGEARLGDDGLTTFGAMDERLIQTVRDKIAKYAPSREAAARIEEQMFSNIRTMRDKWSELFSHLGGTLSKDEIANFKNLF